MTLYILNDTATTEIYTLSLHDALPISVRGPAPPTPAGSSAPLSVPGQGRSHDTAWDPRGGPKPRARDRKSPRLNSSHATISYAVFCLKKKKRQAHARAGVSSSTTTLAR